MEAVLTPLSPEIRQARALARMKALATGLFVVMAIIFVGASYGVKFWPWLAWVRAFAEAAMVGALADWFAVVALFRRPLGLPIPHTAIIPNNKERVADTMGRFIQENFLSEPVLTAKIAQLDPARRLAHWLSDDAAAEKAALRAASASAHLPKTLDDARVQRFLHNTAREAVQAVDLAQLSGMMIETLMSGGKHQELFDRGLRQLEALLERHSNYIREVLREELPWYIPDFVHDRVYAALLSRVRSMVAEVNSDLYHPFRARVFNALEKLAADLKTSPDYARKGEELKEWLISEPLLRGYSARLLSNIRDFVAGDVLLPDSRMKRAFRSTIIAFARDLGQDDQMMARLNTLMQEIAANLVRDYRAEVVAFVADTVRRWEPDLLIEKIELQVGKDLQFIRLNGTLVGGLAGLAIYALSTWLIH